MYNSQKASLYDGQTMSKPGFFKRLIVMVYDALLLSGALLFTSLLMMAIFNALAPDSFYLGTPIEGQLSSLQHSDLGRRAGGILLTINAILVSFFFYGWFWTHGGQTLGMKVWHLYLVKSDGKFIGWRQAAIRYMAAIASWCTLGLGFIWILISPSRSAWHDSLSSTMIVLSKPENQSKHNK